MKDRDDAAQLLLPGATARRFTAEGEKESGRRIPHLEILKALQDPSLGISGVVEIYRLRVLPVKTRGIHLLGKKAPAQIIETLLGYELKASYKRIQCPDKVTARYLKVFSEIGCRTIRLPYDPTVTAELLPSLEKAVAAINNGVREIFAKDRQLQTYVLREICRRLRSQLKRAQQTVAAGNVEVVYTPGEHSGE